MSKIHLILILLILPLTKSKYNGSLDIICVDCKKVLTDCEISTTGHICRVARNSPRTHWTHKPEYHLDLRKCIPKEEKVLCVEDRNFRYASVWSPSLGCQLIIHSSFITRMNCHGSSRHCPCQKRESSAKDISSLAVMICLNLMVKMPQYALTVLRTTMLIVELGLRALNALSMTCSTRK
ncbi:uncharacterized protein LOC108106468 isoform X1 [Drosophila eugracilis]|uniref:uncharacterized protein LOC108106468 isoform X1 n=1 Tax=Drosophila eugracilis TaxID=29029 RepID=UPI0007E5BF98|nr:uncharacterized protein LOC108106468 isoform X1 [Drosophila eugracilis]